VNFKISKNSCVGIKGISGSGKTTLGDLLLGLLQPTTGTILVDNVPIEGGTLLGWRRLVSHVPQFTYLSDENILKNIVFGTDEPIDDVRLWSCIELASLTDTIKKLPEGLNTRVGDRGIGLSGGQRQRIGRARALYQGAEFIVFDEPTSSQDPVTCSEIMNAIKTLIGKKTVVIISHDYEILKICTKVYNVVDGRVFEDAENN
jgi:HlyD family secretion protein